MKYIKIFENYQIYENTKFYYEFDAIEFYNDFIQVFNIEKNRTDKDDTNAFNYYVKDSELYNILDNIWADWRNIPISSVAEQLIKDILENKKVEFFDLGSDLNSGKVKYVNFIYYFISKRYKYEIDFYESYNDFEYSAIPHYIIVDQSKTVKVYGEPTEIEKYIDLYSTANKYNL